MMKPEACANCGSPDISGWVTGKPSSFKRSSRHKDREMLYLCPSCFRKENVGSKSTRRSMAPRSVAIRWQFALCPHWTVWKALRMGALSSEPLTEALLLDGLG